MMLGLLAFLTFSGCANYGERLVRFPISHSAVIDTSDTDDTSIDDTSIDTCDTADTADTGKTDTAETGDTGQCSASASTIVLPELNTTATFAVIGGSTITNTGSTILTGNLGLYPGSSVTGFPPGTVTGTTHISDGPAIQAQLDTSTLYVDLATRAGAILLPEDISGMTLPPGVYNATSSLQIGSSNLILDGEGNDNATWIFQVGSTFTASSGADMAMINCGDAANVFWQVGTSATIGTGSDFTGTVVADQSITVAGGASVLGHLLAIHGAVTLDTNLVSVP